MSRRWQATNLFRCFFWASALVLATALGVLGGAVISEFVSPRVLRFVAGGGFIAVGLWVLVSGD